MKALRYFFFLLLLLKFSGITYAQNDTCGLRITLITCAPGEELYSIFGHSALRVTDGTAGTDLIFNYGTFEFSPEFYKLFIRGKLLYYVSIESFPDFVANYQWESRSIIEQELILSCSEKEKLYDALRTNALPENKFYRYDFLFDNCSTRLRDIVAQNTDTTVVFENMLPEQTPTFRHLIHTYLNRGGQYWSRLGIDMLLGIKLDRKVSTEEAMFLPDYLKLGFDNAYVSKNPLVTPAQDVLVMPSPLDEEQLFRPSLVFALLLLVTVVLKYVTTRWSAIAVSIIDFFVFFITGLSGMLMLFMWFGTDHIVCQNNYNLLWALPTHAIAAFFVHKRNNFSKLYFGLSFWYTLLVLVSWFFLPQQMNHAIVPLLLLILFRSWYISKRRIHVTTTN
ncbi:MAG: DUF4105 domain-containing protein [Flavisolibacter sp.]|jgi:hypothetical protein|nr:DUF4105 domain-containing protein [Flavisolibacter sp.]